MLRIVPLLRSKCRFAQLSPPAQIRGTYLDMFLQELWLLRVFGAYRDLQGIRWRSRQRAPSLVLS